jgi:transposase
LDVHKATITVAVAVESGPPTVFGTIADEPAARKVVRQLGREARLVAAYEAGPTGYALHRELTRLGVECTVAAPSLIPVRPGDRRIKTDSRDALALARLLRNGDLTAVWVPDPVHEALRDLVRARYDAKDDLQRARHRLAKFLLRQGGLLAAGGQGLVGTPPRLVEPAQLQPAKPQAASTRRSRRPGPSPGSGGGGRRGASTAPSLPTATPPARRVRAPARCR